MTRYIGWGYGLILIIAAVFLAFALRHALAASPLVNIFEMRFGVPGTAHVVPECSCTFRYEGTRVSGHDYFVHFRKLD